MKLKPCPFCGGEADLQESLCAGWFVECECGATSRIAYDSKKEAIEAWNRRKPIDKIVEQLEERRNNIRYDLKQKAMIQTCIEIVKSGGKV